MTIPYCPYSAMFGRAQGANGANELDDCIHVHELGLLNLQCSRLRKAKELDDCMNVLAKISLRMTRIHFQHDKS